MILTEYVKSTNFASKDALSTGNPLKIVKGTEIDTEFNNIATSIATKASLNSPTFIGTPAAPTPEFGDNDTSIATTAFVQAALQSVYPVGSIYINAGVTTNPATLLGFGTWTAFGAGRVMVGLNGSDTLFDTLEETGGSKDAIVVSHTHTATSTVTDPGHIHTLTGRTHSASSGNATEFGDGISSGFSNTDSVQNATTGVTVATTVASTGSSGTNANLQPYITVAMWKRTA
jgi:hypothetical protein